MNSPRPGALELEFEGQLASLVGLGTHIGIDRRPQDLLRCLGGHLLDTHAALTRRHDHYASRGAIDHGAEVQLARDVDAGFDIDPVHRLPVRVRLNRDQAPAQPVLGEIPARLRDNQPA